MYPLGVHALTRVEVARRLGKSVATVRRLEHRVLFPWRDERGVLRFNESDVERARRDPTSLRVFGRSRWFEDKVRDDAERRRIAPSKPAASTAEVSAHLANDLQAVLYSSASTPSGCAGAASMRSYLLEVLTWFNDFESLERRSPLSCGLPDYSALILRRSLRTVRDL